MLYNQLKANLIKLKHGEDDLEMEEKTKCKMSKEAIKIKQNPCNCNCKAKLQIQINVRKNVISKILIAFIFMLQLVILLFGIKHVVQREQYLEMSKRQEQALQTAQEELHVLKLQMKYVLLSTHENRISNRFHNSIKSFTHKFFNSSPSRYRRDISPSKAHYDKAITILPFALNQTMNFPKNKTILNNATISLEKLRGILNANLTNKKENLPHDRNATFVLNVKTQNRKTAKDDMSGSGALQRNRRKRKDGEQRKSRRQRQNKERSNRARSGPLIATFIGEIPEQHSTHLVSIGPWIKSNASNRQFDFNKFYLVENGMAIEVNLNGLYMLLTQIFYNGSAINHAYWILIESEGISAPQRLGICAVASGAGSSCHTSIITYLQKGDRLLIQQQQNDRYINLRKGYSHMQLVLLSEEKTHKRAPVE